jgi:Flp pilus assembly protein TadG
MTSDSEQIHHAIESGAFGVRAVRRPTSFSQRVSRRLQRRFGERGYIAVTTAIVLPLMLISLAGATDAVYYYARVIEIQRAADTAALAGVVRMPRTIDAQRVALETAKRNGFEHGVDGVKVVAEPPSDTNRRLGVTVEDNVVH